MTAQVLSILKGVSSFLQIRRTTIKAWMSLNFVPSIMQLAPPEHLKIDGHCCDHSSAFIFHLIFPYL